MPEAKQPAMTPDECPDAPALAALIQRERERLRAEFQAAPSGRAHSLALCDLFDGVVRRLFTLASEDARAAVEPTGVAIAVLATGGYGRRELCPRSDIDLSFIAAEEEDPYLDALVRRLFFLIMDVFTVRSELKVGYAFRVPDECAELEPQTRTALLEGRRVAGDEALPQHFRDELLRTLRPAAFVYDKQAERRLVWQRHGGAVHRAEPDIKEGAGGLRDLHFVEWLARAQSPQPLEDPWGYLVATGDLEPACRARVGEAHEFLLRVRHALHYACDRRFDALTRVRQEEVAASLGYADVRALMADYYAHAEVVHAAAVAVAEKLPRRRLPLAEGLVVQEGAVDTADPESSWTDLAAVTTLFRESQRCGLPLRSALGARVATCLDALPPEPAEAPAGRVLLEILRGPGRIHDTLRQMVRWGVLQRLLPEFAEALRLVPPAAVHEYTVGEHALRVVALLEEARDQHATTLDDYARVFAEVQHPELLFLAALLHDLGKCVPDAEHAAAGAVVAEAIARRLGLEPEAAEMVAFLVRQHLLMSDVARLRDLTEERTIRDFTALVSSVGRLNKLFLLTYADLRATGGGVWTPVQERFLQDLYYRALRALAAPEPEEDLVTRVQRQRRHMERALSLQNLPPEVVQAHCNAMPPAYLLNTPVETIARHIRLAERLQGEGPVVEFVDEPGRDYTTVVLCTFDDPQPGLLSKIAAAFYAHNLNVHGAQVYTRDGTPGIAIDTLWVDSAGRRLRSYERAAVEKDLLGVLNGQVTAETLLRRRGKPPTPDLSGADVHVHNDVAENHTVIEVRTPDRRGLLYRLTERLSALGWDIHSARINTIGGEARDAFYVTAAGGKLVEDAATIRARLLA